jgi:hypothetical protein
MVKKFGTNYACCVAIALAAMLSPAHAGYDGTWVGKSPAAGDCGPLTVILIVSGNTIGGTVSGKNGNPRIRPVVFSPTGVVNVDYARFTASIRFSGNQFTGQFNTFCGVRQVVGTRSS